MTTTADGVDVKRGGGRKYSQMGETYDSPIAFATLVLFGLEHPTKVTEPATFQTLAAAVSETLSVIDVKLACRGRIEGERGRNIAPRKGRLTGPKIDEWSRSLDNGVFQSFEVFDHAWSA